MLEESALALELAYEEAHAAAVALDDAKAEYNELTVAKVISGQLLAIYSQLVVDENIEKKVYPGHSLPVGGVPVRRPLIGPTCNKQRQPPRVCAPRKAARRRRAWTSTSAPRTHPRSARARARL